jgi:predicted ATPase
MITLIEAKNFLALRYIRQPLRRFEVLTGPNAAGKTTFLDVLSFLSDLVRSGPEAAIKNRTDVFSDLVCGHLGSEFELAIEASIPSEKRQLLARKEFDTIRYEVRIGTDADSGQLGIAEERAILATQSRLESPEDLGELFPREIVAPASIFLAPPSSKRKVVLRKNPEGSDNFYPEALPNRGGGWLRPFKFGPQKPALANIPDDGTRFPVTLWLRDFIANDVQRLVLDSLVMRKASPPGQSKGFKLDGSNLPWVIKSLIEASPDSFNQWIAHVQTALPDLETIRIVERPEDRHAYLVIKYLGGLEVPSWTVSDGTLRLLALTLPPYLPELRGVFLIEEPENGIHPKAVEAVIQSLSSVYHAQVLIATHSPIILSSVDLEDVLCFQKDEHGQTDVIAGPNHPALRDWKRETSLGVMFASGILG